MMTGKGRIRNIETVGELIKALETFPKNAQLLASTFEEFVEIIGWHSEDGKLNNVEISGHEECE